MYNSELLSVSSTHQGFLDELQSIITLLTDIRKGRSIDVSGAIDRIKVLSVKAEAQGRKEVVYKAFPNVNLPLAFDSVVANLDDATDFLKDGIFHETVIIEAIHSVEMAHTMLDNEIDELLHCQSVELDDIEYEELNEQ